MSRDPYVSRMRERFKTVEPVFAWMKWATGFDRFRLRGKDGAPKEFLLLSIGHNIKQIAKYMRTLGPEDRKRALALTLLCRCSARVVVGQHSAQAR